jgi:CBS domain-containing protein
MMIAEHVRDILVDIKDFPVIDADASVREAYAFLQARHTAGGWRYRHMLVRGNDNRIQGVISLRDLLAVLMPEYIKASLIYANTDDNDDDASLSLLWQEEFRAHCQQAAGQTMRQCMTPLRHTVRADAPITRAAYLMIAHGVHMLPVLDGEQIVGVVRIVDVFNQAAKEMLGD